jgi:hypothetical protein
MDMYVRFEPRQWQVQLLPFWLGVEELPRSTTPRGFSSCCSEGTSTVLSGIHMNNQTEVEYFSFGKGVLHSHA